MCAHAARSPGPWALQHFGPDRSSAFSVRPISRRFLVKSLLRMPPSTIIKMPATLSSSSPYHGHHHRQSAAIGGFNVCCCRLFTCVNVHFLSSRLGLLKLGQVLLGSFCQWLLMEFGQPYAADIGQAFAGFVTTVASCLTTATILLGCYTVSPRTMQLVRQSLFEVIFNAISCCGYLSASSYMAYTVKVWLYPRYLLQTAYIAYPAMMAVYFAGAVVGVLHGLDAYDAFRQYRACR